VLSVSLSSSAGSGSRKTALIGRLVRVDCSAPAGAGAQVNRSRASITASADARPTAIRLSIGLSEHRFPLTPALSLGERIPRHSDALCTPEPQVGPLSPALSPSEGERGNRRQFSGEPRFRGRARERGACVRQKLGAFSRVRKVGPPLPGPLLQRRRGSYAEDMVASLGLPVLFNRASTYRSYPRRLGRRGC